MKLFGKYRNIKDFLNRFTLLKVKSLHIRLHFIKDCDRSSLYHNHPFNYISIILKGGYIEKYLKGNTIITKNHNFLSVIKRGNDVYHRIDKLNGETITLFIAYGKYTWNAVNTIDDHSDDGLYLRIVNDKEVWSKRDNGIWFIGNADKTIALAETRHSIHQMIPAV